MKTTTLAIALLLLGTTAYSQSISSTLPRAFDAADNPSPTSAIGWYFYKLSSPDDLVAATGSLPTTANLVHLTYSDTDNFVPQIEYRCSNNGGFNFGAPVVLHKLGANEVLYDEYPQLVSQGHNVFFAFFSNIGVAGGGANWAVYAYGSNDAGQTWQGPLLMSPALTGANPTFQTAPTPELDGAAGAGRLHVTYEVDRVGSAGEQALYASAGFDATGTFVLLQGDVDMSALANPSTFDVDSPRIDADGLNVGVIWRDNSLASNNTTFARISNDGGATFGAAVDVSQGPQSSADQADIAISGGNIYCCYEDGRNGSGDNLFLMFSNDGGATWTNVDTNNNLLQLNVQNASDVDQFEVEAHGNTLLVSWMEDLGNGNSQNKAYAWVDTNKGADTVAGTVTAVDLSALSNHTGDINIVEQADCKGRFMSVSFEGSSPSENAVMAWSCDSGQNWTVQQVSDGTRDVDEPYCESTLVGDHNLVFLEDFAGGNAGNKTVVTGIRTPTLENDTSASSGVKVSCAAGSVGCLGFAVFSNTLATKASPGIPLPQMVGLALSIRADLVFNVGINILSANPGVYSGLISANGDLSLPNIPNFSSLVGADIYCVVVSSCAAGSIEYTDPAKLR